MKMVRRLAWGAAGFTGALAAIYPVIKQSSSLYILHHLIRALSECRTADEIFSAVESAFAEMFGLPFGIITSERGRIRMAHQSPGFELHPGGLAIAANVITWREPVRSPTTWAANHFTLFVPLITWKGAVGALAIPLNAIQERKLRRRWAQLDDLANLTGMAILRARLEEEARIADRLHDTDRFQKALLHSISHNVKTPLSSIIGVLSTLQESPASVVDPVHRELIETARQEAERLNRLLSNLLDLSRIEAGALRVRTDPCDVQDVIGAALEQLGAAARARQIDLILPQDLPFVPMDFVLIVQVLVNLIDNALKYSPDGTPVTLEARVQDTCLEIAVSDRGHGIAQEDLSRIFEKFNRARLSGETGGVGLGLSICKGLIEAHHGKIWAERRQPDGTIFRFTLPLAVPADRR